jgi:Flp pilus assembly secretin CpaC
MQQNMKKHGAIKSRRTKTLVLALSAGVAVMALVNGTTAQPANNPPLANATNTAPNNVTDLITDGLTDGRINLAVNKAAVITTKTPIKRIVIGQPDLI